MLWHSFGTAVALLQEIINIYPSINPATLTAHQSNRVCNALALLQCVASHPETRSVFLQAQIPLFLYPFLHTTSKTRPFEYLRLTSLGVIGALVKVNLDHFHRLPTLKRKFFHFHFCAPQTDEQEVITFLLTTEIIPLCLRIMESGSELSKTVATFILQKILLDDSGLSYICQTYDRFSHVAIILVRKEELTFPWALANGSSNASDNQNQFQMSYRVKWWYIWQRSRLPDSSSMLYVAIYVYRIILGNWKCIRLDSMRSQCIYMPYAFVECVELVRPCANVCPISFEMPHLQHVCKKTNPPSTGWLCW